MKTTKRTLRENFHTAMMILFLTLLPTQLGRHFFLPFSYISGVRIDYLAPTIYLTDIIAFIIILFNIKPILKSLYRKEVAIIALLCFLNIVLAYSPAVALYRIVKIFEIYALYIAMKRSTLSPQNILGSFIIGAAVEWTLAMMQFMTKHSVQGIFYLLGERYFTLSTPDIAKIVFNGVEFLRPYGTFSHPNSMSGFYLLIYAFVLTAPYFKPYPFLKNTLVLFCSLIILLTCSKITIIVFVLLTAYYLLQKGVINCTLCKYGRIIGLIVVSAVFLSGKGDPVTIEKRITLMQNAATILWQRPLFGNGLGNYIYAQAQFPIKQAYFFLQPVHNIFLLFFTEAGLILGGFIVYYLWKLVKRSHYYPHFVIPLAAIILTGLLDHYWLTLQQNWLLLPVIFGLPLALKRLKKSDTLSV
jgi:hypothetical protein